MGLFEEIDTHFGISARYIRIRLKSVKLKISLRLVWHCK